MKRISCVNTSLIAFGRGNVYPALILAAISGEVLGPIYTVRLCSIRQAYGRPTTWIVSCKSNLQLAKWS